MHRSLEYIIPCKITLLVNYAHAILLKVQIFTYDAVRVYVERAYFAEWMRYPSRRLWAYSGVHSINASSIFATGKPCTYISFSNNYLSLPMPKTCLLCRVHISIRLPFTSLPFTSLPFTNLPFTSLAFTSLHWNTCVWLPHSDERMKKEIHE